MIELQTELQTFREMIDKRAKLFKLFILTFPIVLCSGILGLIYNFEMVMAPALFLLYFLTMKLYLIEQNKIRKNILNIFGFLLLSATLIMIIFNILTFFF